MSRVLKVASAAVVAAIVVPSVAFAAGSFTAADMSVHVIASLVGLVVAVVALVQAWGLRKLVLGSALAQRMVLVVLAVICLAASALAEWATNFVADITLDQAQLASELLVVVAMALLAAYFFYVRSSMKKFLDASNHPAAEESSAE